MTCRTDFRLAAVLAAALVAGCGESGGTRDGIENLRAQVERGDARAVQLTLEELAASGTPRTDYAALAGKEALERGDLVSARKWLGDGQFSPQTASEGFRLLSKLAYREGNLPASIEALERARAVAPDDPELWVDIGRLRYNIGNQFAALDAAQKAVELGPDNAAALRFRGHLARDSEGMVPATEWFARARQAAPRDQEVRIEYAAALLDAGDVPQAIDLLYEEESETPAAHYLKAVAAARSGAFVEAREALDRSGAVRSRTPAARLLSAIIDIERGNLESAAQTLDQLQRLQPDNRRVAELLAFALSRSGGEEELVYRFAEQARGPLGSVWLRTLVGRAYEALGDREQAAVFLDLASSPAEALAVLPPTGVQGGAALAKRDAIRVRMYNGDFQGGLAAARSFTAEFPNSSDAWALQGDAALAAGDRVGARQAYGKAASIKRSWPLVLRLSAALESEDAARVIAEYAAANPANGHAAAFAASAYAEAGKWQEAADLFDRALKRGMRGVPWVLAARSVAAGQLGEGQGAAKLNWALEAYETQRTSLPAITALLDALPPEDRTLRSELQAKLAALSRR
ncbi:tetratricopeptide repeat protein [Erythrobacter gaetbuli]|uniref:Tetratricopeptide repeat protein n=1 Tax=Qipengyuania gaetbuli TaxID=266952 RepID=A0A844XZ57_9SPHN|nr:tetratricopeptide repeat protein [Qipengyuania gaetbuli]MXO50182.1 tetratricopeptide repeat protein [Qipengyuania gaetbuli]